MEPQFYSSHTPVGMIQARLTKAIGRHLVALIFVLAFSTGPAWSFDTYDGVTGEIVSFDRAGQESGKLQASPTAADSCLPLLKSIRHISPNTAVDRNQRSAGKVAAIGLLFGVRFALAPPGKAKTKRRAKPSFEIWNTDGTLSGNRNALAVSAYRQCQKENALKALGDFRWAR